MTESLTFLSTTEQGPVLLQREVDFDEVCTSEELHDHSRRDDGRNSEFHERSTIRGEDDTHPVEWVSGVGGHDAIQRHLRANQENEQSDGGP